MLDEKDLAAIAALLDARLDAKLDAKLDPIIADIAEIKEIQAEHTAILAEHTAILAEHTAALNVLIEWADECREVDKLPLPKLM